MCRGECGGRKIWGPSFCLTLLDGDWLGIRATRKMTMLRYAEFNCVRDGQIVIRPMMYLALSYDHRLIDGREAVTALKTIKEAIEDPTRLLIDL